MSIFTVAVYNPFTFKFHTQPGIRAADCYEAAQAATRRSYPGILPAGLQATVYVRGQAKGRELILANVDGELTWKEAAPC